MGKTSVGRADWSEGGVWGCGGRACPRLPPRPRPSLVGMTRFWQQRLPGTRQVGQETDRGRSLRGRAVGTSGTLPCCLAFLLLRPTKTQPLFRNKHLSEASAHPKAWLSGPPPGAHAKDLPIRASRQPGRSLASCCCICLDSLLPPALPAAGLRPPLTWG